MAYDNHALKTHYLYWWFLIKNHAEGARVILLGDRMLHHLLPANPYYEHRYQSMSQCEGFNELKPESQRNRKGFSHLPVASFLM
jgi:hypothetical protein